MKRLQPDIYCQKAVSYTHLDVYKRQEENRSYHSIHDSKRTVQSRAHQSFQKTEDS